MIQIAGTDYEQPTDKAIVNYDEDKYVLVSSADLIQRVKMDEIQEGGQGVAEHDHDDEILRPYALYPPAAEPYQRIRVGYSTIGQLIISDGQIIIQSKAGKTIDLTSDTGISISKTTTGPHALALSGVATARKGIAEAWDLYPCSLTLKEDVSPIESPLLELDKATGITYTQDNIDSAGIAAEDLEQIGLPGLVSKDKDGEYISVNPSGLIPLMWESLKDLKKLIEELTLKVNALERG